MLSFFAEMLINSRALIVSYQNQLYFPVYGPFIAGKTFDLDYAYETNYRDLKRAFEERDEGDWVLLPVVPYDAFENDLRRDAFPPYAPSLDSRHYLGTDSTGRDIVARLVYGFRLAIGFALLLLVWNYLIGIAIGCAMGYWGGLFDLLFQRIIEIWNNVPFPLRHHDRCEHRRPRLLDLNAGHGGLRLDKYDLVHANLYLQRESP